jgi:ribosome biogenesis protein BMS1
VHILHGSQLLPKRKKPSLLTKNAVVMEPDERRVHRLMQQINTIKNDKLAKKKDKQGALVPYRVKLCKTNEKNNANYIR